MESALGKAAGRVSICPAIIRAGCRPSSKAALESPRQHISQITVQKIPNAAPNLSNFSIDPVSPGGVLVVIVVLSILVPYNSCGLFLRDWWPAAGLVIAIG